MSIDTRLIREVKRGNQRAFAELFHRYRPLIFSICLSVTKNVEDAEELAIDVFTTAYHRMDQLKAEEKFLPWLRRIAQNRSRNFLRDGFPESIPLSECSEPLAANASPEEEMLQRELLDAVMDGIKALPDRERQVIQAFLAGLSHREIGRLYQIAPQTSMNRLSRARKRVLASLKELRGLVLVPKVLAPKQMTNMLMRVARHWKIGGFMAITLLIGALVCRRVILAPDSAANQAPQETQDTVVPAQWALEDVGTAEAKVGADRGLLGKVAPDFELADIEGEAVRLSNFRGQPVLLNFWATWCIPCRKEMPYLNHLAEKYRGSGLVVLGLNNDWDIDGVLDFAGEHHIDYPILVAAGRAFAEYHVQSLPHSVYIDSRGLIRQVTHTFMSEAEMESRIKGLLSGIGSGRRRRR